MHDASYRYDLTKSRLTNWEEIEILTLKHAFFLLINSDFKNLIFFGKQTLEEIISKNLRSKL